MGDAKHDGLSTKPQRGSDAKNGYRSEKRAQRSEQFEGAGSPDKREDIPTGQQLADTEGERVQGLRAGRFEKSHAYAEQAVSMCSSERPGPTYWLPEPNVGRVVDGCSDRVDRIRQLGNGVVPQTAAKAWEVLDEELANEIEVKQDDQLSLF